MLIERTSQRISLRGSAARGRAQGLQFMGARFQAALTISMPIG